jgi:hypothetical protein
MKRDIFEHRGQTIDAFDLGEVLAIHADQNWQWREEWTEQKADIWDVDVTLMHRKRVSFRLPLAELDALLDRWKKARLDDPEAIDVPS